MSAETTERLRVLLRKVLSQARIPSDLRREIEAALSRRAGGPGRRRAIDHDEVCRLRASGVSVAEIAERLGVSRQAVYVILASRRQAAD